MCPRRNSVSFVSGMAVIMWISNAA